jgi:hypothetical protein
MISEGDPYKEGDLITRLANDQALMLCPSAFLGGNRDNASCTSSAFKNSALVSSGVSGKYVYHRFSS